MPCKIQKAIKSEQKEELSWNFQNLLLSNDTNRIQKFELIFKIWIPDPIVRKGVPGPPF